MHNFREMKIWQKAREFVKEIYKTTAEFPSDEKFALALQMQRAAVSIPSNIAEGAGRNSDKDFNKFLSIANGSAFELETQIYLAYDLNYIDKNKLEKLTVKIIEIKKMIYGFKKNLKI
ncbi:hypothetical protein MNBD_IGNAVI01-3018 [hydrothermal vent metagenome]|uniref:Four helix bundle protein n=1 Tax=hydrothermal vent metagenome TaxID=652676 RepID=A0A3B1CQT7_9ZZZZ